jgi:hypothetical protein
MNGRDRHMCGFEPGAAQLDMAQTSVCWVETFSTGRAENSLDAAGTMPGTNACASAPSATSAFSGFDFAFLRSLR